MQRVSADLKKKKKQEYVICYQLVRADSGFALSMKNSKPVDRFQVMLARIPVGADVMVGPGNLAADAGFQLDYDETTRICTGYSLFGQGIPRQVSRAASNPRSCVIHVVKAVHVSVRLAARLWRAGSLQLDSPRLLLRQRDRAGGRV